MATNAKRLVCVVGSLTVLVCIICVLARGTPMYWKPRWQRTNSRKLSLPRNNNNVTSPCDRNTSGSYLQRLQLNITTPISTQADYKPLNMPCPGIFLPAEKLLEADWMVTLRQFLSGLNSKQVNFVTGNSQYEDELLNWLILVSVSINPPMENVLVLALDSKLYDLLHSRRIPCVFIPTTAIMSPLGKEEHFESVWMIRLGLLRVLNWLGFDAAMYDADALVLKNPQPLFKDHTTDIVASMATSWPPKMGRKWGFTLCNGMVFFRSNERTEEYWETLSKDDFVTTRRKFDDQVRVNHALNELNITWSSKQKQDLMVGKPIVGTCQNNLTVTVLPRIMICRHCQPSKSDQYYIWHNLSGKNQDSKKVQAKLIHHWFLQNDWKIISNKVCVTGRNWLKLITDSATISVIP